nr:hypothetical protein [Tanacetum cinerariifolium]
MRTRSSSNLPVECPPNPSTSNPKRRNRRISKQPFILEESLVDTMADQRTMAEFLRAPTEGYAEAIMVSLILAEQFELKHRAARRWLEKEPPHSILTWEDLVSKFINEFFSPSRTTNLRNEISNFQQRFDESFHEAWDRYKDLIPDQDSLNSAAGGNLLERRTQYVLTIIQNKSKVRNSRNKSVVSQVKSSDANSNSSSKIAKLTHAANQQTNAVTTAMTAILKQFQATPPPASVKAVEEICVTCGGAHPYYQWSRSLPSNTVANPKGELKSITTRSGIVLDGPSIPIPLPFINPEEDERVEETLTDQDLAEDHLHPNIPYPSRILKQKQQEKDKVQIYKFWQMFKQLHINITLANALILIPKYHKMLKALISNKEKLQELENTPLNENCSSVILKKLPKKLEDPGKFLILCGFNELKCKALADLERGNVLPEKLLDLDSTKDLHPPHHFDIESNLKEIEYLLHHDPIKDIDSILMDSTDQSNLADLNDNLVESMLEMFTKEHALDYSSLLLYNEYDDDLFEVESNTRNVYDDPFDFKGEKIKESKLLINELDIPCDFLLPSEYDSFFSKDFFKNEKKLAMYHASSILEDFDPPLYELPFFKEVPMSKILLSFSSENKEKVFKLEIHTFEKIHSSLIPELSHQGYKVFKINQILKCLMKIFLFSCGKDTHILDVPCLYFYPPLPAQ